MTCLAIGCGGGPSIADGPSYEAGPLGTYAHVYDWRELIYYDLLQCRMPPIDAPSALSSEERDALLDWVECGAADD